MSKKILILSTSPRERGNSALLANSFAQGARKAGHETEHISLHDKTIGFCKGCLSCQQTRRCIIADDVSEIIQKMKTADALVFATPIYFYEMCGQMKTLLDRTNPLFPTDYAFRDVYLLASAAANEPTAADRAVQGLQGWVDCFGKTRLKGVLLAPGVTDAGDIRENAVLGQAFEMGQSV